VTYGENLSEQLPVVYTSQPPLTSAAICQYQCNLPKTRSFFPLYSTGQVNRITK